jgi:hypothetical protein
MKMTQAKPPARDVHVPPQWAGLETRRRPGGHSGPNWREDTVIGQAKLLIPRTRPPDRKTRLAGSIRCCPSCEPMSAKPYFMQDKAKHPSGGHPWALSPTAWKDSRRFAVQIGLAKNLIWTGVAWRPAPRRAGRSLAILPQPPRQFSRHFEHLASFPMQAASHNRERKERTSFSGRPARPGRRVPERREMGA